MAFIHAYTHRYIPSHFAINPTSTRVLCSNQNNRWCSARISGLGLYGPKLFPFSPLSIYFSPSLFLYLSSLFHALSHFSPLPTHYHVPIPSFALTAPTSAAKRHPFEEAVKKFPGNIFQVPDACLS